jgi:elongation factor G
VHRDEESGETIISGMGELHLEVYIERMKREYKLRGERRQPQVAYRETITQRASSTTPTRSRPVARASTRRWPASSSRFRQTRSRHYEFVDEIVGGAIPREYIPSCDKGFREAMEKGVPMGFPVVGVRCTINDGASHAVDSSDMAFKTASLMAFREAIEKAKPVILEPIMKVVVESPRSSRAPYGRVPSNIQEELMAKYKERAR